MTAVNDPQASPRSPDGWPYNLEELLGPDYLRQSCAEVPGIPRNWNESWSILRATLDTLEASGNTPYMAVLGLLHVELIREQNLALDSLSTSLSMDHLQDRLGTNYVPSATERKQLLEFCAQGSQTISKVTAEIDIDHHRLISSYGRRLALRRRVDPHLELISPMRAVPPEILQEIFMACLPEDHNAIMHTSEAPLLLGRVCSAWRTISLSTAALWASVHVVIPTVRQSYPIQQSHLGSNEGLLHDLNVMKRSEGLQIWLQRSGDCSLSISLFHGSSWGMVPRPFLDTVISYSRRWKAITVLQVPDHDLDSLFSLGPEDVPLLEAIEIVDNSWVTGPGHEYVNFYAVPPNLRTFSLQRIAGQRLPACSWHHITDLHLESQTSFYTPDIEQTLDLIEQCVNLESCRLALPADRVPLAGPFAVVSVFAPRRITLPHLHTLSVRASSAVDAVFNLARILDSFIVPAVEKLTIWNLQTPDTPVLDDPPVLSDIMIALDQLVERSSCSLRSLYLDQPTGDIGFLHRCLRRAPGLSKLALIDHPVRPVGLLPILGELIASPSSPIPPLCPSLIRLRLGSIDITDSDHPVLQNLIESRCGTPPNHTTRLKALDLILSHMWSSEIPLEPSRFLPSQVYVSEPYDYRRDNNRERWAGILTETMGPGQIWGYQ